MQCEYSEIKEVHPTSCSCIYKAWCKKYKRYCYRDCKEVRGKENGKTKKI